jgi:hypothetical protein
MQDIYIYTQNSDRYAVFKYDVCFTYIIHESFKPPYLSQCPKDISAERISMFPEQKLKF